MHREQFYKEASVCKRVKQNRIALLRGLLLVLSIKFRFFFGYFPQCWSVWAQPSLLFQSISKCWGLSPVTGLGTADSVYRVGYSQCAQANITKTEWIFDEDVTCFSICLHKDVSLFYAFMLLVRCLIISEATASTNIHFSFISKIHFPANLAIHQTGREVICLARKLIPND